jgi:hypothetical protein
MLAVPGAATGLDHVGIEGALDEELDGVIVRARVRADDVAGGLLEDPDELSPDDLALLFRVTDPGERGQEAVLGIDDHQVDPGRVDEVLLDLLGLAGAQQAVVDEDTGQLVTDRALDERSRHRGVHATGEATDDPRLTDRAAHLLDEFFDDIGRGPVAGEPGASPQEVLEDLLAEGRVHDLGVPLNAIEPTGIVLERSHRRPSSRGRHAHALRGHGHRVAVRHPHRLLVRLPVEESGGGVGHHRLRRPELREPGLLDRPPERLSHRLEAVTHAEDRHPGLEQRRIQTRRSLLVDRRRTAGEDDRRRILGEQLANWHRRRDDLAEAVGLAHAAGDELGVLRAEIDDDDGPGLEVVLRHALTLPVVAICASTSRATLRSTQKDRKGTHPASITPTILGSDQPTLNPSNAVATR